MKALFKACMVIYTIIAGLLIPVTLLLKISSFNRGYYPTGFILFLLFLFITFISLIMFQSVKNTKSLLKQICKYILAILVFIGFCFQVFCLPDLFKARINSALDVIVAGLYLIMGLASLILLAGLFTHPAKLKTNINA